MHDYQWNEDDSTLGSWPLFVDRNGEPISRDEAYEAIGDINQRRIGYDVINQHGVSTVWLVLNHSFGGEVPIPFETMIFAHHDGDCALEGYQERYPTEAAARAGHEQAMAEARDARCGG